MQKIQSAHDAIRSNLKQNLTPHDPKKMPLAAKQLVSFQNRQWINVLLMSIWSVNMKTIMLRYQELHDQDGVILWYCFLQHFARTTVENFINDFPSSKTMFYSTPISSITLSVVYSKQIKYPTSYTSLWFLKV